MKLFIALIAAAIAQAAFAQDLKVVSESTVTGFPFPESVGCDTKAKVLYVSQFVSALKPAEKDGKGRISKVGLDGKMIEEQFLPAPGAPALNKPKGIWVAGERLWVTDIDVVWVFDTKTRKGRRLELTGAQFANDPAVKGRTLYVSDNRADALFKVEPANFLNAKTEPKVTRVASGQSINPNGLYPARDGSILMVGFAPDQTRGIYALGADGKVKVLAKDLGRLDGVYQAKDGTLLVTDWASGSLLAWSAKGGKRTLASGFKGPADFCVMPEKDGLLVIVPDLAKSELRLVHLGK
jgi:hypothetical protein